MARAAQDAGQVMAKRINTEQFLELAKDKFCDKFKYDLENYKNMQSKIDVFCSIKDLFGEARGWFTTRAEVHLRPRKVY
ncbi:hypothetical protein [Synechococcus sp. MIT S9508]|uniref:hypothetical protein n=1 Tax=Synechococcus sp. MIT S9508 TaxID=1801629 RepID=UPI00082A6FA4|nr:hypothetical protein [Synechococcus sp. MIT S9508]